MSEYFDKYETLTDLLGEQIDESCYCPHCTAPVYAGDGPMCAECGELLPDTGSFI